MRQPGGVNCLECGGTPPVCGDDILSVGEVCDGTALAGQDCQDQGFIGGTLACAGDCDGFDTSGCVANGGGDCCSPDGTPGCDDLGCTLAVCSSDPACCDLVWDADCVTAAEQVCLVCGGMPTCLEEDLGSDVGQAVDAGGNLTSALQVDLLAGQSVFIVVSGFNVAVGNWTLNITEL